MAHPARFERAASTFGGWRSIQLSYGCIKCATNAATSRRSIDVDQTLSQFDRSRATEIPILTAKTITRVTLARTVCHRAKECRQQTSIAQKRMSELARFARTSHARYAAARQTTSHAASVVLPRRIRARREQKTILLSARKYERKWRTRRDSNSRPLPSEQFNLPFDPFRWVSLQCAIPL